MKDSTKATGTEGGNVFDEDPTGGEFFDEPSIFAPESGSLSSKALALSSVGEVLTGEASAQEVDSGEIMFADFPDVMESRNVWPVLDEDLARVLIDFHLEGDFEPGPLQPQLKSANSAKQTAD